MDNETRKNDKGISYTLALWLGSIHIIAASPVWLVYFAVLLGAYRSPDSAFWDMLGGFMEIFVMIFAYYTMSGFAFVIPLAVIVLTVHYIKKDTERRTYYYEEYAEADKKRYALLIMLNVLTLLTSAGGVIMFAGMMSV